MRTLRRNKTKLHYALFGNLVPIYSEYTDEEGNVYKIETGEYETKYFEPVSFLYAFSLTLLLNYYNINYKCSLRQILSIIKNNIK